MDLRMRRVNGIDATRALRSDPEAPPVLVLTTFDDDELLAGALRAGRLGVPAQGQRRPRTWSALCAPSPRARPCSTRR